MAKDQQVAVVEKKLSPVIKAAEAIEIDGPRDMVVATELLSKLNIVGDAMKAQKEAVLRPALDTVNAVRLQWKPIETIYEGAIALIRGKMTKYQTEAKRVADAERDRIAARVGDGKGKLQVETAVRKMEEVDSPASAVSTDAGLVKFKTVRKFEVLDMKKLPLEYHIADEVSIRKAMVNSVELPGVKYWSEEVPINFRG